MASAVINTRKDLDAIAGTPQHDAFMALLAGTLWRLEKDDTAQAWVAVEDNSTIERFGFARTDFPDAVQPKLPAYDSQTEAARIEIERKRDATLAAGLTWNGNKYHIDQTMIAALNGRLTLWQEGKIAADAKLPVRRMDNAIELLDRAQHADLADALRLHGEAVYAASWVEKDKL